jgi:hypothetical protein
LASEAFPRMVANPNQFPICQENYRYVYRLTTNIINGDCRGLKDFYITEESKKLTRIIRSTENGDLIPTTIKNIPNPGFRNQSAELWNTLTYDRKISKLSLTNYP